MIYFVEGENDEEPICKTTEVEVLPSIDFCKFFEIITFEYMTDHFYHTVHIYFLKW